MANIVVVDPESNTVYTQSDLVALVNSIEKKIILDSVLLADSYDKKEPTEIGKKIDLSSITKLKKFWINKGQYNERKYSANSGQRTR